MSRHRSARRTSRSWDPVADWYLGWVGRDGSRTHRSVAIPALLDLLAVRRGERVLDLGCGPGVLAPHVAAAGAAYTGVDLSPRLLAYARRHHGTHGQFLAGDVTRLAATARLGPASFDAATFLLSIQDIDPLEEAIGGAAWALSKRGRIVILMLHPCFRVPRQSGWGYDGQRALRFRRIDSYLTPLAVPMQDYGRGRAGATRSYHRPLEAYAKALGREGFAIECLREIAAEEQPSGPLGRPERRAVKEIPLFLGLRASRR